MGFLRPPKPPSPAQTAAAQMELNREAARENALLSQMNQQTPFARTYYTGEIGTPGRTQYTELHPILQSILFGSQGGSGWGPFPNQQPDSYFTGGKGGRPMR